MNGAPRDYRSGSTEALIETAQRHADFSFRLFCRDHVALPDFLTRDAMLLPAGRQLLSGRDRMVEYWTEVTRDPQRRVKSRFEVVDNMFAGDSVIEAGVSTVSIVCDGEELPHDRGKYLVVWRHEDGRWRIHRDIFNSDLRR